jgi:beta-phosphoglucomutase
MRILAQLMGSAMTEDQIIAYADRKNDSYRKLLEGLTHASLMPQTRNILNTCREQGYRTAIASASRNTRDILRRTGIYDLFDTIVDGNDVQKPKPNPACFFEAAERLGLDPQECLILEDSNPAITAAAEAGFPCVGVGEKALEHTIFHVKGVADLDFDRIP